MGTTAHSGSHPTPPRPAGAGRTPRSRERAWCVPDARGVKRQGGVHKGADERERPTYARRRTAADDALVARLTRRITPLLAGGRVGHLPTVPTRRESDSTPLAPEARFVWARFRSLRRPRKPKPRRARSFAP
jgi:hypothetical protein